MKAFLVVVVLVIIVFVGGGYWVSSDKPVRAESVPVWSHGGIPATGEAEASLAPQEGRAAIQQKFSSSGSLSVNLDQVEWVRTDDSATPIVPRCPVCKREVAQESTGCFSGHRFIWRPRPRTECVVCGGTGQLSCSRDNVKTACDRGVDYRKVTAGPLDFRQYTYCVGGQVKTEWSGHERDLPHGFTCSTCDGDQRFSCWRCKGGGDI